MRSRGESLGVGHRPGLVVPVCLDMAVEAGSQSGRAGHILLDGLMFELTAERESIGAQGQEGDDGVDFDHLDGYELLLISKAFADEVRDRVPSRFIYGNIDSLL